MSTYASRFRLAILEGRGSFGVTCVLATIFWWPAIWAKKIAIHGDSVIYGLPLLKFHARALHGNDYMLWASRVTSGHPLFAESQGSFLNPLNSLVAYVFKPAHGIGVLHWLGLLVGAAGVYWLCRVLEIGRWASTFASLAVVFSGTWIVEQHNLPISSTIIWAPWLMAALEFWLKRPTLGRALWLALPIPLLVFAGYPQITYGAVLYVGASLLVHVVLRDGRRFVAERWRSLAWTGALAAVLAVGLSAIQLVPLLELAGLSHRSDGIGLAHGGRTRTEWVVRGLLYFYQGTEHDGGNQASLASLTVALTLGLALFVKLPPRVLGQWIGGFVVFNLAMANGSPLFRLLYEHGFPGLHSFRIMRPLHSVGVIGLAVAAAYSLDALARDHVTLWRWFSRSRLFTVIAALGFIVSAVALVREFYSPVYTPLAFAAPLALALGCGLLAITNARRWLPALAVAALTFEVASIRLNVFAFQDERVLRRPEMILDVLRDSELKDYRVLSVTGADAMTFMSPADPRLPSAYERVRKSLTAFPTLDAGVASMDGPLGLSLQRWAVVVAEVRSELERLVAPPPGQRLMDIFAVRYVTSTKAVLARGVSLFRRERDGGSIKIFLNEAAKPRFQVYRDAALAHSAQDAIARLRQASAPVLMLEPAPSGERPVIPATAPCAAWPPAPVPVDTRAASSRRYDLRVDVPCDAWLFLADANYPGWTATVNGSEQPVFIGQGLGKAVRLSAGPNEVVFEFVPLTFYLGAAVTTASLLAFGALAAFAWRRSRSRRGAPQARAKQPDEVAADPPGAAIGESG